MPNLITQAELLKKQQELQELLKSGNCDEDQKRFIRQQLLLITKQLQSFSSVKSDPQHSPNMPKHQAPLPPSAALSNAYLLPSNLNLTVNDCYYRPNHTSSDSAAVIIIEEERKDCCNCCIIL